MGLFHMIKVVLNCREKYLQGGGAETIWIESGTFGVNVVQSVLNGRHYVRSVKGMTILSEALQRIQWMEFFKLQDMEHYTEVCNVLRLLKDAVAAMDHERSWSLLIQF